jgi:hypothetical protein
MLNNWIPLKISATLFAGRGINMYGIQITQFRKNKDTDS